MNRTVFFSSLFSNELLLASANSETIFTVFAENSTLSLLGYSGKEVKLIMGDNKENWKMGKYIKFLCVISTIFCIYLFILGPGEKLWGIKTEDIGFSIFILIGILMLIIVRKTWWKIIFVIVHILFGIYLYF